jgi:hypothetical protein
VRRGRPDLPSVVGGAAIALFGAVLLLDQTGAIDIRFAALAPIVCATMGAILVASGLSRRG